MKKLIVIYLIGITMVFSKSHPQKFTILLKQNIIKYSIPFNSKNKFILIIKKEIGKKYVWGAVGPNTFDCSGLIQYTAKKSGIKLPRTSREQSKIGKKISKNNLKEGDLIFFDTSKNKNGQINHVGVYIGNGNFIHASSLNKKVITTKFKNSFYEKRFKLARRI